MQISDLSGAGLTEDQLVEMRSKLDGFVKVFVQKDGKTMAMFVNVIVSIETGKLFRLAIFQPQAARPTRRSKRSWSSKEKGSTDSLIGLTTRATQILPRCQFIVVQQLVR
jgi:hypothetical protein